MPIPDDEQFERHLKQFRPLAPEPLPTQTRGRATRRRFVLATWAAAVAAVLVVAVLVIQPHPKPAHLPDESVRLAGAEQLTNPLPLTIGNANALLAQSSSVKAALDQVAFQSQSIPLSKGARSALAVLSKENFKL